MTKITSLRLLLSFCFASLILVSLTGCEDMQTPTMPMVSTVYYPQLSSIEPPPLKMEEKAVVEDPLTSVWRGGYWSYNGSSYDWVSGDVIARPSPTAIWTSSTWERRQYGWAFIPGFWQ